MTEEVKRQKLNLDDLKSKEYLSLKIGEEIEFTIKQIDKVKVDKDFALSGVDFRYEIRTMEDKVLSVSAWKLWGVVRAALTKAGQIEGTRLKISHLGRENYLAEVVV